MKLNLPQTLFFVALTLSANLPLGAQSTDPPASTKLYVVHFTTGSGWDTTKPPQEQPGMKEHSANLARLRAEGMLVTGARYKDSQADKGMIVLRAASREAVEAEFGRDPMVSARRFNIDIAEFKPFYDGFVPRVARVDATRPLAKFAWLTGCWEGREGNTVFREHWMPEAGNVMMAMSRTTRDGRVVTHEAIRLEIDGDGGTAVYAVTSAGQKEVRFKLGVPADGKFIFENPQNDFPQRIIYRQQPDGSLFARIEGAKNEATRAMDFPMKRANCE